MILFFLLLGFASSTGRVGPIFDSSSSTDGGEERRLKGGGPGATGAIVASGVILVKKKNNQYSDEYLASLVFVVGLAPRQKLSTTNLLYADDVVGKHDNERKNLRIVASEAVVVQKEKEQEISTRIRLRRGLLLSWRPLWL